MTEEEKEAPTTGKGTKPLQPKPSEKTDRTWVDQYYEELNQVLHRFNYFLVFTSFMFVAFVTLITNAKNYDLRPGGFASWHEMIFHRKPDLQCGCYKFRPGCEAGSSPFNFFMNLGIRKEKMKSPIEKKTLKDISSAQLPEAHTSLRVPIKKVKMNVPTMIPSPVPKK